MKKFYRVVGDDPFILAPADYGLVDGYAFGDRLLEGVMFKIKAKDGVLTAEVMPRSAAYFEHLNKEKWLAEAVRYAERNDLFEDREGNEVLLYDHSKPWNEQNFHTEVEPQFRDE